MPPRSERARDAYGHGERAASATASLNGESHTDALAPAHPARTARTDQNVLLQASPCPQADPGALHVQGCEVEEVDHRAGVGELAHGIVDREVGVAEPHRAAQLAHAEARAHAERERAEVPHQRAQRLGHAERRDERDAGAVAEVALVREQRVERQALAGAVARVDVQRERGRLCPDLPRDRVDRVAGDRAEQVPVARCQLVGDCPEIRNADRVLDHRVDVCIGQEQRAPPESLERMAEGPDVVAVPVGHGPDGTEPEVAGGDRSGQGGAGAQVHGRVSASGACGRHQQRPLGLPGRSLDDRPRRAGQPRHRERSLERARGAQ